MTTRSALLLCISRFLAEGSIALVASLISIKRYPFATRTSTAYRTLPSELHPFTQYAASTKDTSSVSLWPVSSSRKSRCLGSSNNLLSPHARQEEQFSSTWLYWQAAAF